MNKSNHEIVPINLLIIENKEPKKEWISKKRFLEYQEFYFLKG